MAARVHLLPRLLSSNRRLCLGRFQTCSLVPKTFSMTLPRTLKFTQTRGLSSSQKWLQSDQGKGPAEKALEDDVIDDDLVEEVDDEGEDSGPFDESGLIQNQWMDNLAKDPKDRSRQIPVETSIAYLESDAYRQTYEGKRIWELHRRNYAKGRSMRDTRKTCIRQDRIATGSPCPICRDEYLVVDKTNLGLITQFINEYNGEILTSKHTHVCQKQYKKIVVAIEQARDLGLLEVDQPFVEYDYSKYAPK